MSTNFDKFFVFCDFETFSAGFSYFFSSIHSIFRLASIKVINVIIPYFFYSKGDQKDSHKRVPITAKLVADLLRKAGASHVMIIEPHTPQLEGFFGTPVDALKVYNFFN